MRIYYIICSMISSIINISLIILFIKRLRYRLEGIAWICIFIAFCMVLYNNLVISYIVVERPSRWIVLPLLISFFFVKVIKNSLWLVGFWLQNKEFGKLENLSPFIESFKKSGEHKKFSETLVDDLKSSDDLSESINKRKETKIMKEPAAIIGVIMAALALAIGFGLKVSGQQVDLIQTFLTAAIPVVGSLIIRSQVVPVAKANEQIQVGINSPKGTDVQDVVAAQKEGLNAVK